MAKKKKESDGPVMHGIGVSPGVAIGHVFLVVDKDLHVVETKLGPDEIEIEAPLL